MTASELISYASWAVYLLIFASTAVKAVRRPLRANIDVALFFLIPTLIVIQASLFGLGIEPGGFFFTAFSTSLYPVMVYMLLRLVDDFSDVPPWFMRASEVVLGLQVVGIFYYSPTLPPWLLFVVLAYLIGLILYAAVGFVKESRRTAGVTSRRMSAAAAGTIALCVFFVLAALGIPLPQLQWLFSPTILILSLLSGIFYFLGFAPPAVLRSAWQEPELRAFLSRAASLPRLPSTEAIVAELERGTANSIGIREANIGLWDEVDQVLRFNIDGKPLTIPADDDTMSGRSFVHQEQLFTTNLLRDSPRAAREGSRNGAKTVLAAPISTDERRVGVLTVYATHIPIFAEEDMRLIKLLADQAAVILESRMLIDEATQVRTREEVTRLKEDFLSAAAHDLKTPLTVLVAQAQILERRAERNPDAPADREGLRAVAREATRLRTLVLELLDAARAEEGKLVGEKEEFDLVAVAEEVCSRHNSERHPCRIDASGAVIGTFDLNRIRQLFENMVENAVKYSPDGGEVLIRIWVEGVTARMTVSDHGIGIPQSDLPNIFKRFHRGTNVDNRHFAGMGLGLYICREIVVQHGGVMTVTSKRGEGTTFIVDLPLQPIVTSEEELQKAPEPTAESALGQKEPTLQTPRVTLPDRLNAQAPPLSIQEKGQLT